MADWSLLPHPVEQNNRPIGAKDGEVTQPSESSRGAGPHHAVRYNATDGRHSRESGMAPWTSVDVNSGEASESDFSKTGSFPDGPGAWRQT